jgi:hypothetical protein
MILDFYNFCISLDSDTETWNDNLCDFCNYSPDKTISEPIQLFVKLEVPTIGPCTLAMMSPEE